MKQILKKALAFSSALALSLSSLAVLGVPSAHAIAAQVTKTWAGTDGLTPEGCDYKFSTGACWSSGSAPDVSDQGGGTFNTFVLNFDATSPGVSRAINNDLVGLKVDAITFSGAYAANPYTITGNAVEMTDASTITDNSTGANGDQSLGFGMNLDGDLTVNKGTNVDGLMTLSGAITTFSGKTLTLTSATLTDTSAEGKIDVIGAVGGNGAVTVTNGVVYFDAAGAANTYTGVTTVQNGGFLALINSRLGVVSAGTVVESGGSVKVVTANNVADEPFTIAGAGNNQAQIGVGAIISSVNGMTLNSAKVTLSANAAVCAVASTTLDILVPTLSTFTLFKTPSGTAGQSSDCTGTETVDGSDTLSEWTGGTPTPTTTDCTSPTTLASGSVGATECAEIADGDDYTGDVTVADGGILIVDGILDGDVTVNGTLKGSGNVTGAVDVTATGTVAPGNSPGVLSTGNISFVSGSTLDEEIGGAVSGVNPAGYDQVLVTGTVDVTGATLNIIPFNNFTPTVGDQFVIIANDGSDAVTGTFNGLAEGATVTVGTATYSISYKGVDASTGNDVVLTATAVTATPSPVTVTGATATPATPNTGFAALMTNPAAIMFSTTSVAGAILAIARKYNLLKVKG